ncbi:phage protein D [Azospirillum fermentarium]|uniref:phage late control D family protein n=1 Tax=Azospirillum fermentarium TaxID=1233114 RepID=UPI0022268174|nr:contractile injection system protein, VgrG/Pvc8 family [Azospirillum fermentarium]MCW2248684.1 phage protein D [Azospirillum fermentarium]
MNTVDTPDWTLLWSGTDVTASIRDMVTGLAYTDKKIGESDDLDIQLEDRDGRWRNDWIPSKGDVLELFIGYKDHLVDAGSYEIDQIEHSGPPDRLKVTALAAGVTTALRTKKSRGFEKKTLSQIARQIADEHGMTVIGDPDTEVKDRITQADQTDLEFLSKTAAEFGYVFSVRGQSLVFMSDDELMAGPVVFTLPRGGSNIMNWRFSKKGKVYKACEVSYYDPATKKTQKVTVEPEVKKEAGDTLKKRVRVENEEQARRKAKALLDSANTGEITASLDLTGRPDLVSGINIRLDGFGTAWDGTYHVQKSGHRFDPKRGYTTTIEVQRV